MARNREWKAGVLKDMAIRIAGAYVRPRASIRALIDQRPGIEAAAAMIVLSYLVQAIAGILVPGVRAGVGVTPLGLHLIGLGVQFASSVVLALMIHGIGRAFGGTGSRDGAFVVVGWHALVTALLAPIFLAAMAEVTPQSTPIAAVAVLALVAGQWFWLLSCFVAELHGFRSDWSVFGVIVGAMFAISAVLMGMLPAGGA